MTFAEMLDTQTDTPDASMFVRAVCLLVEFRRLGTRRKVSSGQIQARNGDTDTDLLHVAKELLQAPELDAINRADGEMRRYLERRVSGPSLFRTGVYLIALPLIPEVDAKLEAYRTTERPALVRAFLDVYEQAKTTAGRQLGVLFDPTDYPPVADVERAFAMRTQYLTFSAPGTLADFRADIWEREQQKAADQWTSALDECRTVLRVEMRELVSHMADRLQPDVDGKRRVFRDSLVKNMDEFLSTFTARNIADDADLAAIVTQARGVLQGIEPDDLRTADGLRSSVAAQMAQIKTTLDGMVSDGTRRYLSEDE